MGSNLQQFNRAITDPKTQAYLEQVLSGKKNAFVNNIVALVSNNTTLQACEPMSVMFAGLKATALDLPLDPNLGFAYVIPYKNNRENKTEAQFQIGYRGFIQLAIRSGQFKTINVTEVREGELETFDLLTGEMRFTAVPKRTERPVIGYAAFFRLSNGFEKTLYMTKEEVDVHAKKYSQTYSSKYEKVQQNSKWATDFDAMAKKTAIKLLLSKYAPLSVDMINAVNSDQAVITETGSKYVDNQQDIADVVAEEIDENANKTIIGLDLAAPGKDKTAEMVVDAQTGELFEGDPQEQQAAQAPGF
ncbi:recombinase RecT [Porphyromonas gingivalis]|uniref:Recombinase RecT n=2 Tax=root TaxID=1 RepID=A0AAE9XJ28_PORGN|nr:recombinase RecT [Porphyromonas gingivalis]WCG02610.1 recombinase RecT [Porphyromonas gingivalis]SJL29173.1 recombination and repair protein RecT [Porphyromonas gingivalis]